jgi:hypothetical protein
VEGVSLAMNFSIAVFSGILLVIGLGAVAVELFPYSLPLIVAGWMIWRTS